MFNTPSFWYKAPSVWSAILKPASWIYGMARAFVVHLHKPQISPVPMICIGNFVAGGGGKTPSARAVMALIKKHQLAKNPCFLTRGYGGDESQLLAQDASTIITKDRVIGSHEAKDAGHDLIVMDDGFQNTKIRAQLNIVVIDGASGIGNGFLLPAGPLREPIKKATSRADAFIIIGEDRHSTAAILPKDKPVFTAKITCPPQAPAPNFARYFGFAGLARPEKFKDTLTEMGFNVVGFRAFPDHHAYIEQDIVELMAAAQKLDARLITTEKDVVKCPSSFITDVLPITLQFDDEAKFISFLKARL
jgi:tetraacyldisaccharide 4'-kinase